MRRPLEWVAMIKSSAYYKRFNTHELF
jgi:hypothetical protein